MSTSWARTRCSSRSSGCGLTVPVLVTGSARSTARPRAARRRLTAGAVESLRRQQARAGDGRGSGARVDVILTRPFNHAGPRQSTAYVRVQLRAADCGSGSAAWPEPVLTVGNLEARRDLTDVRDTVRAYRLLVERGQPAPALQRLPRRSLSRRRSARLADSTGAGPDRGDDRSGTPPAERQSSRARQSGAARARHRLDADAVRSTTR